MTKRILFLVFIAFFANLTMVIADSQQKWLEKPTDLTVVGSIDFNGSVHRHAIGLIECLHTKLSINFIASRGVVLEEVPIEVQKVILSPNTIPGRVALLEDPLWFAEFVPDSKIKIAFSVCESTSIPDLWVEVLNAKFDAVVVADPWFVPIYKKCGVVIPIFHLPLGIYIDDFLEKPLKNDVHEPFVFCCCSRFFKRKNHPLLIKAFAEEFGNRQDVILKLNGGGNLGSSNFKGLTRLIRKLNVSNILITNDALAWRDYVDFMSSSDCYINIAKGEGFSITPREALALGIPTILSNNTAQKTICDSSFVRAIPSNLVIPDRYGYQFDCELKDVRNALRDVYENYHAYLLKAHQGREWSKQYRWDNLQKKYLNLIKPTTIILGDRNEITDDYLMTNTAELYQKYLDLKEEM